MSIEVERATKKQALRYLNEIHKALSQIYELIKSEDMQKLSMPMELSWKILEWQLDTKEPLEKVKDFLKRN